MSTVNIFDYVFPIIEFKGEPTFENIKIRGTGFLLGNAGIVMSAWHVFNRSEEGTKFAIVLLNQANKTVDLDNASQDIDGRDIGCAKVNYCPPTKSAIALYNKEVHFGTHLYTYGYPTPRKAVEERSIILAPRYFEGYIIREKLENKLGKRQKTYEISFPCPGGLSGAPVFYITSLGQKTNKLIGLIYGNEQTYSIEDYEEIIKEGEKEKIIESKKIIEYGKAYAIGELETFRNELTENKPLKDFLPQNKTA